jgi:endoribonuclease LACTB2
VYITHHHEDHSGNVNSIATNFKVPIYGSLGCSELVQGQVATSLPQRLFWGTPVFTDHVAAYEQSRLSTPKYDFELLPIPGHAVDQVALFEPNQGWLFSADAFVSPQIKYFMKKESMVQQIQSLKKMARLDFDLLLCCHTPVEKKGGEALLEQKINHLEQYYTAVVYYYKKGQSPREILKSIGAKERWFQYFFSGGNMSAVNIVESVIRDEKNVNNLRISTL